MRRPILKRVNQLVDSNKLWQKTISELLAKLPNRFTNKSYIMGRNLLIRTAKNELFKERRKKNIKPVKYFFGKGFKSTECNLIYFFLHTRHLNVKELRRSGKFKTCFLDSDSAYVNSLMKSYIEQKKWIKILKLTIKMIYIEDKVKDLSEFFDAISELFKNYTTYEITNQHLLEKKMESLSWLSNE